MNSLFVWFRVYSFADEFVNWYNKKYQTSYCTKTNSYAKIVTKGVAVYGNEEEIKEAIKYIHKKKRMGGFNGFRRICKR